MFPIVTHSGKFHSDEVMAVAMIDLLGLWDGNIIRTRDMVIIANQIGKAFIIDVGGVYNPENLQFDHHQSTFNEYFNDKAEELGIKMSSCGLIYLHLGAELFGPGKAEVIEHRHLKFYKFYIQEIDANDNGVSELRDQYTGQVFRFNKRWNLNAMVGNWNSLSVADSGPLAEEQDARFYEAVNFCKIILKRALAHFIAQEESYDSAIEIIKESDILHYQGTLLLVLDEKCDYYKAMQDYEQELDEGEWVLSVLPREDGKSDPVDDKWQIHTVDIPGKRFQHKVPILKAEDAKELVGDDLIFVHNNRFVAATKNKESAILLAKKSIVEGCKIREIEATKEALAKWRKMMGAAFVLGGIALSMMIRSST